MKYSMSSVRTGFPSGSPIMMVPFPCPFLFNYKTHRHLATFVRNQTKAVLLSNIGIFAMAYLTWRACQTFGVGAVVKYYGVPWMFVSHWFIMITYLHHTDPVVPRYRNGTWTYARGMASTIDRDFLGAPGKFFLHGIAHYHVVHHFFPRMPFCKSLKFWCFGAAADGVFRPYRGSNGISERLHRARALSLLVNTSVPGYVGDLQSLSICR